MESTPPQTLAIRCDGLHKRFPDTHAVRGIQLSVGAGECLALLGPNGAGKTTTVEMIEGLTEPSEGLIEIFGRRWGQGAASDRAIRASIGVCLQESSFQERLSIRETIDLFRSFYTDPVPCDELIGLVALESKAASQVGKLSGGQRQRLAIACALAGRPRLLCLDEPSTGLDPQSRRQIHDIVSAFRAGGGTVLLTTHYMEEAQMLADRVAIMDHGQVIARGTSQALIASLGATEIATVTLDRPMPTGLFAAVASELGTLVPPQGEGADPATVRFTTHNLSALLPEIFAIAKAAGVGIVSLSTHSASLEDVFIHYTGRGLRDA